MIQLVGKYMAFNEDDYEDVKWTRLTEYPVFLKDI